VDTIQNIQVGEDKFTDLETFVKTQGLHPVKFDAAKRIRKYTLVVNLDGTVRKAFVEQIFHDSIVLRGASRGGSQFSVKRNSGGSLLH